MKLPVSYKDLRVKDYQSIHPFIKDKMTFDDWMTVLSKVCGLTIAELETIPLKKLKDYFVLISFLGKLPSINNRKYLRVGKHLLKKETDAENLCVAQYATIKELCKDGNAIQNIHHIAACSYRIFKVRHKYMESGVQKSKWFSFVYDANYHKEISESILTKNIQSVYGVVFFCSKALKHLMVNTEDYLKAQEVIREREQEILRMIQEGTLLTSGDGMQ